ncbi:MAG: hypothetical protein M1536_04210 [Firmicutes bacterium]|nr:hypothetical protein [Bacillota bacterium]
MRKILSIVFVSMFIAAVFAASLQAKSENASVELKNALSSGKPVVLEFYSDG